jgi:hypothetical protein
VPITFIPSITQRIKQAYVSQGIAAPTLCFPQRDRRDVAEDQGWRLKAELDAVDTRSALDHLLGRLRGPDVVGEIGAAVPHDVVITHDGKLLFAYAETESVLTAARAAIEGVLRRDGVEASICVSHWDEQLDEWRQIDPPLTGEAKRSEEASERDAETVETRTMVASAGKLIRATFDQSMLDWAERLGLQCELIEHPHLLTTQVAFTVTGPKRKIDEFAEGLKAEELATMRAERGVMLSSL